MAEAGIVDREALPRWRRIIDFPLVAMVIAVGIFAFLRVGAELIDHVLPGGSRAERAPLLALITVPVWLLANKYAFARLGEMPREELPRSDVARNLGLGLAGGFLLFSAVLSVAALADVYNITGYSGFDNHFVGFLAIAALTALTEELLFRGILFRWIEEFAGSWVALGTTSALFGLAHLLSPHASGFAALAIAVEAGLLFGGAYMLTRSLWFPIGLHAAWNFTQGTIFGVPVSGGSAHGILEANLWGPELLSGGAFGLEASVFALVACTTAGVCLVRLAVKRGEVVQPAWVKRRTST